MKNILKLEELGMFLFSIYAFSETEFAWWWFPALLILPDLSMAGYFANPKAGALCYNIAHHKGVALFLLGIGVISDNTYLQLFGIILFAHSSMDRIFGYGLKYNDDFSNTHLGIIGKTKL